METRRNNCSSHVLPIEIGKRCLAIVTRSTFWSNGPLFHYSNTQISGGMGCWGLGWLLEMTWIISRAERNAWSVYLWENKKHGMICTDFVTLKHIIHYSLLIDYVLFMCIVMYYHVLSCIDFIDKVNGFLADIWSLPVLSEHQGYMSGCLR